MVTLNIVPVYDPPYSVDDSGAVHLVLKDIANEYSDGSNPQKDFIIQKNQKNKDVRRAVILATEEAIDYFRKEAEKIEYRNSVLTEMKSVKIPPIIFEGDPDKYEKTEKKGINRDEIIIADSVHAKPLGQNIYEVTALVIGKNMTRSEAKPVTIRWNKNSGMASCQDDLISAFRENENYTKDTIIDNLKTGIGTVIPE